MGRGGVKLVFNKRKLTSIRVVPESAAGGAAAGSSKAQQQKPTAAALKGIAKKAVGSGKVLASPSAVVARDDGEGSMAGSSEGTAVPGQTRRLGSVDSTLVAQSNGYWYVTYLGVE